MTGSQHFSPDDSQFQLVYDRGQCAESNYLNPIAYGILRLSQLQGWIFYPHPREQC